VGWPFTLSKPQPRGWRRNIAQAVKSSPPGSLSGVGEGLGEAARSAGGTPRMAQASGLRMAQAGGPRMEDRLHPPLDLRFRRGG
jgi:hypothetical protein